MCMANRYEALLSGKVPSRVQETWEKLNNLKNVMHKVDVAAEEHFYLPCTANRFKLTCRGCKCFSHCGMCKHVLAVTHMIEQEKAEEERDETLDLHKVMRNLKRGAAEDTVDGVGVDAHRRHRRRGGSKMETASGGGVVKTKKLHGKVVKKKERITGGKGGGSGASGAATTTTTTMKGSDRTKAKTGSLYSKDSTIGGAATRVVARGVQKGTQPLLSKAGARRRLWGGGKVTHITRRAEKGGGAADADYEKQLAAMIKGWQEDMPRPRVGRLEDLPPLRAVQPI